MKLVNAKWDQKTEDGKWLVSVRCGGRGESMVGQIVTVRSKDGRWTNVTLGRLVQDYGPGDVAIFELA